MSRHATCDRCGRSGLIQRADSLPIGWMVFTRDKREPFNEVGFQGYDSSYDLCDLCFVDLQQEITLAKIGRS